MPIKVALGDGAHPFKSSFTRARQHAPKCALPAVGRGVHTGDLVISAHRAWVLTALQDVRFIDDGLEHCFFLVGQIHKPIAGVSGSHVGALQPGKVDNQCVVALPPVVFRWIERSPPTVGCYPGTYLRSLG